MPEPIELQGEGSYEYRCKKKECWYCDIMVVEERVSTIQIIKIEKGDIAEAELYNHTLKKPKKTIPQIKPNKTKIMFNNIALMTGK